MHIGSRAANRYAQTRLQQHEDRRGGPGLRRTGHGIKRGAISAPATEATKEFREPLELKMEASLKHALQEAQGVACEPILSQTKGDKGIVVRPHRSVVIRHRVV